MTEERINGNSLLWNWARWCWSGETPGNMPRYVPQEDDHRPIVIEHALVVDAMHRRLPRHEGMVVIAEYPQKNVMFAGLTAGERYVAARRWIRRVTGAVLRDEDYRRHMAEFLVRVERELL